MQRETGSPEIERTHRQVSCRAAFGDHRQQSHIQKSRMLIRRSVPSLGIILGAGLLLAAAAAQEQFGAQPVKATSGNQGITVTPSTAGTVSPLQILTLGSASGDFAAGTGTSSCASATLAQGATCTVSVTFTPAAPGPRLGAVVLVGTPSGGSGQSVLGTAYLSGTGTGGLGVLVDGNLLPVAGQLGLY